MTSLIFISKQITSKENTMKNLLILISVLFVSACAAGETSLGKMAEADSKAFAKIAKQYEKGESITKEAEKDVTKGRKLAEKGREDIRDGEKMVAEGNQLITKSRGAYANQTDYVSTPFDRNEVKANSSDLDKTSKAWKEGIKKVEEGNKMIAKGNKRIEKGEEKIREGRKNVEKGQDLMKKSRLSYDSKR